MQLNHLYKDLKKKQKHYYSGKKKRHTIKTQIVIKAKDLRILSTSYSNGKKHDFRLYKESKVMVLPTTQVQADTGYQGIQKDHKESTIPHKRKRKTPLSKEEKQHNHTLSSKRVAVEHVIGFLKRFKIIADKYRNRRKRFGLRFNLIAGIYNYELV
jgi:hypothetical protein